MGKRTWRIIEASAVALFAFQAVRVLLAMLFARVYDALFEGQGWSALAVAGALVLVMVIMPILSPRDPRRMAYSLRIAAVLCALARVPLSIDIPLIRTLAATATLGFAGLYVATLLRTRASMLPTAMSLGLTVDQLSRAMGHTYDLSLRPWWGFLQILISLGVIVLAERLLRAEDAPPVERPAGFWAGIAYGAALFALSSLLALPNAAARWTGVSYAAMVAAMLALTTLPLWPGIARLVVSSGLAGTRWARVLAAFLLLSGLILAYRGSGGGSALAFVEALIVFWLLLPSSLQGGRRDPHLGVALGMLIMLLLSTAHAFSFTYPYSVRLFKGLGLPVLAIGSLMALGPAILSRQLGDVTYTLVPVGAAKRWLVPGVVVWLMVLVIALPGRARLKPTADVVHLGSYNIHYGYNAHWNLSLEAQARTVEASGAEVVVLQEVDAGRLTSYGIDDALWLSRRLGMRAIYLPTIEHLTGIALLSRLEVGESRGTLLPSTDEPTGIVGATVRIGG
ncbi:MAG: hypothetical protein JXA74_03595, partial [Anaerolineae bacterium]|nr:hypothetical protein [Anaerolineae bacterium]